MIGWITDFFRLWWGLLYWNTRKTWFRLRPTRARCPCQNPSDSGKALETQCDACLTWVKPARFRRVCPLLVETPEGLRCSVNTPEVRPFWGITGKYYGAALFSLYVIGVVAVFAFLRTIGYPISIVHVGLPPLWHKVGQARGWFFLDRANKAFNDGRTQEGLLYLSNSYEFDPTNYQAGLALAKHLQAGHATRSDTLFRQLLVSHPEFRHATAQDWYRALLPRGDFKTIIPLAADELIGDPERSSAWMRALLFASRQTNDPALLQALLASRAPLITPWHRVLETELLLRAGNTAAARAAAERPQYRPNGPLPPSHSFTLYHRITTLMAAGAPLVALDLLEQNRGALDADAYLRLKLDALAAAGSTGPHRREFESAAISSTRLHATVGILCAHLIRYPNREMFERILVRVAREKLPFNSETAGTWLSLLCTAGAIGDNARVHELVALLKQISPMPFIGPSIMEAFFRGETLERTITTFLPSVPIPLEVTYAMLERFEPAGVALTLPKPP